MLTLKQIIVHRRKWLDENSIEDWNDADTEHVAKQIKFPKSSDWINEFKKDWMRDNDIGVFSKNRINEMWQQVERTCNVIYKYQRKSFESQFQESKTNT